MRRILMILTAVLAMAVLPQMASAGGFAFMPVDIYVDSGQRPLAAYQFELRFDSVAYSIVGIEGGEGALAEAPYYDNRGMEGGRIIIASGISIGSGLGSGRRSMRRTVS